MQLPPASSSSGDPAAPPTARRAQCRGACSGRWYTLLAPWWRPVLALWSLLWVSRGALMAWQADRITHQQAWGDLWLEGLRFDGVLLGMVWLLPLAVWPWLATRARTLRWGWATLRVYALLCFVFVAFMELATPPFMAEYDVRPNYVFVEYLTHVQEVGGTLLKQYPWHLALAAVLLPLLGWAFWRGTRVPAPQRTLPWPVALVSSLCLVAVCGVLARGSLGHRPANPALAALTQDGLVNQLPLSSAYTLLYALYQARKSEQGGVVYGTMAKDEMLALVRAASGHDAALFHDPQYPTRHWQGLGDAKAQKPAQPQPYNLVIVLEESLGAEFVGRLGGTPVTPNLERLAKEGIWFEQLYATGTRSVRGIEAVTAGFPPTSAPSTVKLNKSQKDFFTLASFVQRQGYRSTFYYGGESHFDNMRSFFMGNGFDRVRDQKDFPDTVFKGTWGASDEALFDLAHQSFQQETGPFFGLVFTSSNHTPFEFPDGAITLHEQPKATVNNAVKYADHALGRFFEQAKQAPYWKNTVFLVVADHNSRVYGDALVPIKRFHIPGLILGGPIRPDVIETVASQLDLGPTLISLLGLQGEHPMIGRDLTQAAQRARVGRAIMQFDKTQAYMEGSEVVVLRPNLPPTTLRYDAATGTLHDAPASDPALVQRAVAHALYAPMAYREGWHR